MAQGGVYAATTSSNGCQATSNNITVTVVNAASTPVIVAAGPINICTGATVSLTSNIAGVQWQKDTVNITGATFQSYTANSSGSYRAYVPGASACGVSYSNVITVVVNTPAAVPAISAGGPVSFCTGANVILTATLTPVQWVKDNVDIAGAINQTLTVGQSGVYKAYTGNGSCFSYSNSITIAASNVTAPVITAVGTTSICSGGTVALTSNIAVVQWQYNGANINGAISQTYNATQAGVYTAVASNGACAAASNAVTVTVTTAPTAPVIAASGPVGFCSGGNVVLASNIAGIQWTKDNTDIGGATNQTLTATQSGVYKAYTSSGTCTSYSNAITVTVTNVVAPVISATASLTICTGSGVAINANTSGVQWQFNGANINGATGQSYNATQAGNYTAVLNSGTCLVTSNALTVVVTPRPVTPIIAASGAIVFCDGGSVAIASNTGGVQWLKDGTNISGATNQTIDAKVAGKYKAGITTGGCTSYSNEITVTVNFPSSIPIITANNPLNVCEGTTVTFNSNVSGVTWQKDNNTVAVNVQSLAATQSGVYRAVLFSGQCPGYSNALTLNVNPSPTAPVISAAGATTFCDGGSVVLASNAGNVQWLKDGANITGATGATFTAIAGGKYKAAATSSNGCTSFSNEVTVVVNFSTNVPTITANGNLNICDGNNVLLSANATGVTWQKDFNTIATNVQSITVTTAGSYRAVNFSGTCPGYSNALVVTVLPSPGVPVITATGPVTFCDGGNVTFASTINNVNWLKDGVSIATGQTFNATQPGKYKAFISSGNCTNYSNEITVAVTAPVAIPVITPSSNTTICDGTNLVLVSNVAGVTWQKDFVTFAINTSTITVAQAGSYRAIANGTCPGYSLPVTVTILPTATAPIISAMGPVTLCTGDSAVLTSNIPNVLWLLNGNSVNSNYTGQTYTAKIAGIYRAMVFGTNGCNGTSNPIPVTVTTAVVTPLVTNATSVASTFCQNVNVNLVSNVQTVQWQKDGANIPGATNPNYTVTATGTYRAVFVGGACMGYSNSIPLTMIPQPLDPIIFRATPNLCDTGNVTLSSTLNVGTMRWQKDSVDIINANAANYIATQSGTYRFVISLPNQCPSFSNTLPVTVNTALKPVILWDGNQFKTFTQYATYQWYLNNLPVAGATANTFKPLAPGNYQVVTTTTPSCALTSDVYKLLVTAVTTPATVNGNIVKQYPNPATTEAFIELAQMPLKAVTIRFLSVTGSVLQTIKTRQQKIRINTAGYANGMYFIELTGTNERAVFKLMLNK